jgi:chemotaxis receptor (MCP) glutamine deamidase CheD
VFYEKGNIVPFEESINYNKRRISDRLNNSIIEDYLKKNGIDINEEHFWKSKGNAIEFSTKLGKVKA